MAQTRRSCGATRQTFYYHFHDKYDLVAWIYLQDLRQAAGPEGDMGVRSLRRMLLSVWDKGDFDRNALQDASQNNLMSYVVEYGTSFMLDSLRRNQHVEATRPLRMAVRYHSFGMVGLVADWLEGTCKATPDELAEVLSGNVRLLVREATR